METGELKSNVFAHCFVSIFNSKVCVFSSRSEDSQENVCMFTRIECVNVP